MMKYLQGLKYDRVIFIVCVFIWYLISFVLISLCIFILIQCVNKSDNHNQKASFRNELTMVREVFDHKATKWKDIW